MGDPRIGPHCTDMAIDSQRAPRAQQGPVPTIPGSVLSWSRTASLTPLQAERLGRAGRPLALGRRRSRRRDRRGDRRGSFARLSGYRRPISPPPILAPSRCCPSRWPGSTRSLPLAADDRVITHRHRRSARPRPRGDAPLRHRRARSSSRSPRPGRSPSGSTRLYRPERAIHRILGGLEPARIEAVDAAGGSSGGDDTALDAPMAKLVDAMISDGVREGASDIHAEPTDGSVVVRYRIDGVLREVMRLPGSAGPALVRRVKVLGQARRHRPAPSPRRPRHGAGGRAGRGSPRRRPSRWRAGARRSSSGFSTRPICAGTLGDLGLPSRRAGRASGACWATARAWCW